MNYPNKYEYDDVTMEAMRNAMMAFWGENITGVTFYKMNDPKNTKKKIDGTAYLTLNNGYELNLQIKRSDTHVNTFSVTKYALESYISKDYGIQALLVGTAYQKTMSIFTWKQFVEYAQENYKKWAKGNYYVIDLKILQRDLYYKELAYTTEDFMKLLTVWK